MHHDSAIGRVLGDAHLSFETAIRRTEVTCRAAVEGRRAARALADWARRFALSEPDFQALWCLRFTLEDRLDQATLAGCLALSPAQVSNTVDRLGTQGWIACDVAPGDRRRHLWQLTPHGQQLLERMLADIGQLVYESQPIVPPSDYAFARQKEAA